MESDSVEDQWKVAEQLFKDGPSLQVEGSGADKVIAFVERWRAEHLAKDTKHHIAGFRVPERDPESESQENAGYVERELGLIDE